MKTRSMVILTVLALLVGGAYYVYRHAAQGGDLLPSQPSTAVVRQADLLVRVSGSGELVAEELPLTFAMPGVISELNVAAGDVVAAGQLLAKLDDRQAQLDLKAARLNWELLTAPQVVVNAEQELLEAQQTLAEAQEWLAFVQAGAPIDYYQTLYEQALADTLEIEVQLSRARAYDNQRSVNQLKNKLDRAQAALEKTQSDLEWALNYQPYPHDLALAEAQVTLAAARLSAQQTLVDVLHGGPLPPADASLNRNDALLALERAWLALKKAQLTLDHARLSAPVAGTVTQVFAAPGEGVSGDPVFTLRVLQPIQVRFYLEETDLAQVSPGDRLEIRLAAYPNQVFEGAVLRLDPALVPVNGTPFVQVWGQFTLQPPVTSFPGMSLEVDVIAVEASAALLVPQQALRQSADGEYFVEKLLADGTLETTPVTIGLKDLANVQILSGLQVGDKVSTLGR